MDVKNIIDRIGYFRTQRNISARELSGRLGNDKSYITRMESGEFNLTIKKLLEILKICEVSLDEFFADNYMTYKEDLRLQNKFDNLSKNDKEIVEVIIDRLKN